MKFNHSTILWLLATLLFAVLSLEASVLPKTNTLHQSSASPLDDYECLRFDGSEDQRSPGDVNKWLFGAQTTYLQSREEVRKVYNSSWPFDPNTCEPVYFYTMNRHGVRYPFDFEISTAKRWLPGVAKRLIDAGRLKRSIADDLGKWRALYHEHQDSHLTDSGVYQMSVAAGLFYKHFPQLLNISANKYEVGISVKARTNETANAFIRPLVEMQLDASKTFEEAKAKVDEKVNERFTINEMPLLNSHEQCKRSKNYPPHPPREYFELMETETYRNLSTQFAIRNNIVDTPLSVLNLTFIKSICHYEQAFYGRSVWCSLFSNEEWKALSYLEEFATYVEAYGYELYRKMTCLAVVDLHARLKDILDNQGGKAQSNTLLYGHSTFMKRLFSFLGLFSKSPIHKVDPVTNRICLPKSPGWVAGLVSPLGSNIVVSMYRCEGNRYKLLSLINEIPMEIRGCPGGFCDVQRFLDEYADLAANCNLDEMCPEDKDAVWLKMF